MNSYPRHFYRIVPSPLGPVTLISDETHLKALYLEGQGQDDPLFLQVTSGQLPCREDLPVLAHAARWVQEYFDGKAPDPSSVPLAPEGSDFRRRVWQELVRIPYGRVITYGDIASVLANEKGLSRMAAQAVGGAVGHNPISLLIPCHRVVGAGHTLTGYAGGLDKKRFLLTLEGVDLSLYHD